MMPPMNQGWGGAPTPQGAWMSGAQQGQGRGGDGQWYGGYKMQGGPQYPPPGYVQPSVRYA